MEKAEKEEQFKNNFSQPNSTISPFKDEGDGETFPVFWVTVSLVLIVFLGVALYLLYLFMKKKKHPQPVPDLPLEDVPNLNVPKEYQIPLEKVKFSSKDPLMAKMETEKTGEIDCFVRTLPHYTDSPDGMDAELELKQAILMAKLNCHHVLKVFGIVPKTSRKRTMVLMEFAQYVNLKAYLRWRREDDPLTLDEMLKMSSEIADGMTYIHSQGLVHARLAAINCFVMADLTIKIGEVGGIPRDIERIRKARNSREVLLVRWMSPEALESMVFTKQSDVWSFGVVLYEIVTMALNPYHTLANHEVLDFVRSGRVLEIPEETPTIFSELIADCWQFDPTLRPTFIQILDRLTSALTDQSFPKVSFYHSKEGINHRRIESERLLRLNVENREDTG